MIENMKDSLTKLAENSFNINLLSRQWHDIRNKIDCLLLAAHKNSDKTKTLCQNIYKLPTNERSHYIIVNFGQQYHNKVEPLLRQLEIVETTYNKNP
jgi:hypothetical protein